MSRWFLTFLSDPSDTLEFHSEQEAAALGLREAPQDAHLGLSALRPQTNTSSITHSYDKQGNRCLQTERKLNKFSRTLIVINECFSSEADWETFWLYTILWSLYCSRSYPADKNYRMWVARWIKSDEKIQLYRIAAQHIGLHPQHRTRQWATTELSLLSVDVRVWERQRLTGSLDEAWIRVVSDNRNGQFPEVELESTRDDVNIFICVHWDVCFLPIYTQSRKETDWWCILHQWFSVGKVPFHKYGQGDKRMPSAMEDGGIFVMHSFVWSHMTLAATLRH